MLGLCFNLAVDGLTHGSYSLPDDVFVEGETKPTKKAKKSAAKQSATQKPVDKKRSANDAGLDVSGPTLKRATCGHLPLEDGFAY